MKQKLTRKNILIILGILTVSQFFGFTSFYIGLSYYRNIGNYGEISSGSLTSPDPQIEIDWGNKTEFHQGTGPKLTVDIVYFNKWNWGLWLPFVKYYVPKVIAEVSDENGKKLGYIKLLDELKYFGVYGRGGIIQNIRENILNK